MKKFYIKIISFIILCLNLMMYKGCVGENDMPEPSQLQGTPKPNIPVPEFNVELTLDSIIIRDPFIFRDPNTDVYYLIKADNSSSIIRVVAYLSNDLVGWSYPVTLFSLDPNQEDNPKAFWAPEVHYYEGAYYIFVTYSYDPLPIARKTCIIRADYMQGEFKYYSEFTESGQYCLDGTLYIEDGNVYGVYCKEWLKRPNQDGEMKYVKLTKDLKNAESPKLMFRASESNSLINGAIKVTDGCFFYRNRYGELFMLWSTFARIDNRDRYVLTYSISSNGKINGVWDHADKYTALYLEDGGHGMVFMNKENKPCVIFHTPNSYPERAAIYELDDSERGKLKLGPVIYRYSEEE